MNLAPSSARFYTKQWDWTDADAGHGTRDKPAQLH
jgi:hypothetical protein